MNLRDDPDRRGPGVKFPPPLLYLAAILAACTLHILLPLEIGDAIAISIAGWTMVSVALILIILAVIAFRRAKTHIEPWRSTSTIISDGVFAISRNPVYLAFCLVTMGIGLILNSWWVLLSFIPAAALTSIFVIKREESYLERKFGDIYLDYKSRVRRWL